MWWYLRIRFRECIILVGVCGRLIWIILLLLCIMDGTRVFEIIVNILYDKVKYLLIGWDVWKIVNNCLVCFV